MFRTISLAGSLAAALALALVAGAAPAASDELRDPLRPPGYGERSEREPAFDASAWQVAYTLVSQGRRVAIVNGRRVRAGDSVGGAEVIAIESGNVTLDYRGRRFTIRRTTPTVRYRERSAAETE